MKISNFAKIFSELDQLTEATKSYQNMRSAIRNCEPPLIPYLGMYQTDLIMIDGGNPDEINGLINYYKYMESIRDIIKVYVN